MVPTVLNSYVTQQDSGRSELYFEVLTCHIFATSIKHIFQLIPFIDWTYWTWQFGKSPVYFDVSPIESSIKMVDFPAYAKWPYVCEKTIASWCCRAAGLYWSLPCIRRETFREIHWVSLSDLSAAKALLLNDVPKALISWAKNLGKLVSACEVKMIFERLLEWFNALTFLHMLCSMEWVYVGSIGLLEKVPSIIPKVAARGQEWSSCWTSCKSCRKMRAWGNLDSRCDICWGSGTATWFTRVSRE